MNNSLQLWDGNLSIITRPVPHVSSSNDVIVKVSFSGVCAIDRKILTGDLPVSRCIVPGHEFAGVVSEVGADVKNVSIGDRVSINPHVTCSTCPSCTRGLTQFCDTKNQSFIGVYRNGGWSQYTRVQSNHVHALPPQISLRHGVLAEPVSCILHGLDLLKPLPLDSKILVNGINQTGSLWLCILHYHGYRRVMACDSSDRRRHLAAGLRLSYDVTYPEAIEDESYEGLRQDNNWGFDVLIDCSSNSTFLQKALKWLKNGGRVLLFGCFSQNDELKMNPRDIISKELKILGCQSNPFTFPQAIQLIRDMGDQYLDFTKHGFALYPLIKYEEAFSALAKDKVMKVVFET